MKKLTILLFSILISFSSYGENFCSEKKDHKNKLLKSTFYFQERLGLFYLPNQSEPYSGENICVYKDAYGQYFLKGTIKNGKKEGKETMWYENGQIALERNFKDGEVEGKFTKWRKNGQKKAEGRVKDDKLYGKLTEWNRNGTQYKVSIYKDGKLNGKLTQWNRNGTQYKVSIYKDDECVSGYCLEREKKAIEEKAKKALEKQDLERKLAQEDISNELKSNYINQIAARVRNNWRYQGAEDHWSCDVYILQDVNGNVQSVNLQSCDVDNSAKAKSFKNSIERAVYKSSPLPMAPDESVFDREIIFIFKAN